jgi:predicted signal transduction protein with EAL and GGDEF domain
VTASLGVAAFPHSAVAPAALVAAADEALYAAKGEGRNRVIASARRVLEPSVPAARQAEQPLVPAEGS